MDLDRGVLARIDRKLLAGLDRDERFQMVRVPVTPAKWATWKRYCDTAGLSMGRAIAALINHELASMTVAVFGSAVYAVDARLGNLFVGPYRIFRIDR